jgi:hypothetical protein
VAVALTLTCAFIVVWSIWRAPSVYSDQNAEEEFNAHVREGVGVEARLPATDATSAEVRAAVDNAANFISNRSAVSFSEPVRARLASMEASALAGTTLRLSSDDLSNIIADTSIERIKSLSDTQITYAAEVLRGYNAPDLPPSFQRGRAHVRLRGSDGVGVTPEEFVEQVTTIKNANRPSTSIYRGAAQTKAAELLQGRIKYLSAALPEQYANASAEMTPLQALILTYSVAADDYLTYNQPHLRAHMEAVHDGLSDYLGAPYASPAGKRAYGVNGYIFSTPLDLAFDEQTINRFLDRIAERSAR